MNTAQNILNKMGTVQSTSDGVNYMLKAVLSSCNDAAKINLREASYKLDKENKLLLIKLIQEMLFNDDIDELKLFKWIKKYHPHINKN